MHQNLQKEVATIFLQALMDKQNGEMMNLYFWQN